MAFALALFPRKAIRIVQINAQREKPGDHEIDAMMKWQDDMSVMHGRAEIIIGKQRHGPIGTVELAFEGQFTKFSNLVKSYQAGAADDLG